MRERIRQALPQGYNVVTPEGRTKQIEMLVSRFQKNINLISFIAVIVGMYLIYNAVSISVVQRRKETGILRALGTTRGQIISLFLSETDRPRRHRFRPRYRRRHFLCPLGHRGRNAGRLGTLCEDHR